MDVSRVVLRVEENIYIVVWVQGRDPVLRVGPLNISKCPIARVMENLLSHSP